MLRIDCPYCGIRDEPEFTFGGPAALVRPALEAGDAEWTDYLFTRANPVGPYEERWCHSYGCGRWFLALRDTRTHEFLAVRRLGEALPKPGEGSVR